MRLLTRYLLRQLAAPFVFALAALTGFMLLNQVAKKFGQLVGKGLDWSVIAEVFALSIPFIVAMTLPMAVLAAVLFTFAHLAADNEITAMRAGGISVLQILRPVLLWGVLMAALNFAFMDQLLPRSNARLRTLLIDIQRKKPTFALREQVINEVPPSDYFLRAVRIEPTTGRMRGIAIYDVGNAANRRIIYADSGQMAIAPNGTDLTFKLWHGVVHEARTDDPGAFDLTTFRENRIRVRDVIDTLERDTAGVAIRGDREMSTCEMLEVVRGAERDRDQAAAEGQALARRDLRKLLGLPPLGAPALRPVAPARGYCAWMPALRDRVRERVRALILPGTAQAQSPAHPPAPAPARTPAPGIPPGGLAPPGTAPAAVPAPAAPPIQLSSWGETTTMRDRTASAQGLADRYEVEVHKKWAISAACITFVLVGIVLALRFPRGGMGLVIGGGMAVYSIFYVGLTAGESLADRGILSPAAAMWWPDVVLLLLGGVGLVRVNRESGSTRGGDLRELWEGVQSGWRRFRSRIGLRPRSAA